MSRPPARLVCTTEPGSHIEASVASVIDAGTERYLERHAPHQPLAVILGDSGPHSLAFVRSLGRRGIPVILTGLQARASLHSRYCHQISAPSQPETLLERLDEIGKRLPHRGVLMATGDAEVLLAARNRDRLEKHFTPVLAGSEIIERLADKRTQFQWAERAGIPIPKSYYPQDIDELRAISRQIDFPCVVKPAYSHAWRSHRRSIDPHRLEKVACANTPAELISTVEDMNRAGIDALVQERIRGDEDRLYSLYTYLNRNSDPLGALVMRKVRQWPPLYGTGSHTVTCHNARVVELGLTLLKRIGYTGLANVEFKEDPVDGDYKLIEINVRSGQRVSLAVRAGVDLPDIAYRDALGLPPDAFCSYAEGIEWNNLVDDFFAFRHAHRLGTIELWRWLQSVARARARAYFSWRDPGPACTHFGRGLVTLATRQRSSIRVGDHQ